MKLTPNLCLCLGAGFNGQADLGVLRGLVALQGDGANAVQVFVAF
jgi:hypothetical protein